MTEARPMGRAGAATRALARIPHVDWPELRRRALSGLVAGSGAALAASAMIAFATTTATPIWLVPFATSIVLVMSVPNSPQAQPRNVLGGHLVSCAAGYLVLWLIGATPVCGALAVGLSVVLMVMSRTLHPPAGVDGLLIVTGHLPLSYALNPVGTGALALIAFACLYHRLTGYGRWPTAWW